MGVARQVLGFVVPAYLAALLVDYAAYSLGPTVGGPAVLAWGAARMWSVAGVSALCLLVRGVDVRGWLGEALGLSRRALVHYLLSPLIAYAALGVYVLAAHPLGLFDFGAYVELLASRLREAGVDLILDSRRPGFVKPREVPPVHPPDVEALAQVVAVAQVPLAYAAAVTVNALLAMGEELGWRGYLYWLLGRRPTLASTIVIGACWGLWHAPAVVLLGYNYPHSRALGVLVFTALTVALTYPHLVVTSKARSVLPACSLHGAINALWPLASLATRLPAEQRELLLGQGLLGILAWGVTAALVYIHTFQSTRNKGVSYPQIRSCQLAGNLPILTR